MIHDPELLDLLADFPVESFGGEVFRATRLNLDPLAYSSSGGRWAPPGDISVLYTSLERDGALAEIAFHWHQLSPIPSKPAVLHRLKVSTHKSLRLVMADLPSLGIDLKQYPEVNYLRTQQVGAAVAFLEYDGLIAPSARWSCDNLMLFSDNNSLYTTLEVVSSEDVDWREWSREHELDPPQ